MERRDFIADLAKGSIGALTLGTFLSGCLKDYGIPKNEIGDKRLDNLLNQHPLKKIYWITGTPATAPGKYEVKGIVKEFEVTPPGQYPMRYRKSRSGHQIICFQPAGQSKLFEVTTYAKACTLGLPDNTIKTHRWPQPQILSETEMCRIFTNSIVNPKTQPNN